MRRAAGVTLLALASVLACPAHGQSAGAETPDAAPELDARERAQIGRLSPLGPPPPDATNRVADDDAAAHLGRFLFFDARLSASGAVSCATCHVPETEFTDGKPLAEVLGRVGTRHTPSLVNAAYQRWFFWDGRADSLWAQALEPIENPIEMGSSRLAVAHVVHADAELRAAYEALFGALPELADERRFPRAGRPVPSDPAHPHHVAWSAMAAADQAAIDRVFVNLAKTIAAYERRLVRGAAPFDRFAEGLVDGDASKLAALDASAQRGLKLFLGKGCLLCHSGPTFSDLEFHNTSAPPLGGGDLADPGRYAGAALVVASPFNAAGPFSDDRKGKAAERVLRLRLSSETWGEFKTPGLRNVVGRGPYMHQGQFATLAEVIGFYSTLEGATGRSHHQEQILVPLRLTEAESQDLSAFLHSLTGAPLGPELLSRPASPLLQR